MLAFVKRFNTQDRKITLIHISMKMLNRGKKEKYQIECIDSNKQTQDVHFLHAYSYTYYQYWVALSQQMV